MSRTKPIASAASATRREFLKLSAAGIAGAATLSVADGDQFQGNSSDSRLIGWAPMRAMTSVSHASGSMPFMRAVPISV